MKKIATACFTILFVFALAAQAQNSCKNKSIEQLANALAEAFQEKKLEEIDATRPFVNGIVVRVENSLADDKDPNRYEYKKLKNFTQFEKWLKFNEIEELPNRTSVPLISCKKGICKYDMQGLLHNTWFLEKFSYGYKKDKCPYIKSVFLIDGN